MHLYSYHFIANSTSYLNPAGFSDSFFSNPVISRIDSIGGGVGGGGGWGAEGGVKHPFGLKGQCCAFSKWHERIQSTREAQTVVRSSLVPHAVLLTHPRTMKCTLVVSQHRQKAVCKSRPGNLLSGTWCFWIVHECGYHVQAKDGFQFLCVNGRFSKIRSHISNLYCGKGDHVIQRVISSR